MNLRQEILLKNSYASFFSIFQLTLVRALLKRKDTSELGLFQFVLEFNINNGAYKLFPSSKKFLMK